jgi:hypothetical protein
MDIHRNLRTPRLAGLLGLIAFILANCAASGVSLTDSAAQTRAIPPGKARVYVYREGGVYGAAEMFDLMSNGHAVARITNGGYYDFEVAAGQVAL